MADSWASSQATRASMRSNRRRDTRPELLVRKSLHSMGYGYRVDFAPLADQRRLKADIVFPGARVAVFIDGCFWHGCPKHYRPSRTNAEFWRSKVEGNKVRDARSDDTLRAARWTVLRFWEHDDPDGVARYIARTVDDHRLYRR
ncbi:very short patch repair endonuclease [Gordonia lacunae]|uniref:Very short patch repair endonuclease n=1 Tax=Gordonia lacunae TaxID=417102 RepID=A0A243QCY0_9ACTN|nr:very short patch repair endonuclease [Gordonia lacunae]OUC79482.1 very short patch repair endonuclease [Gordonia lacunae]